VRVSYGPYLGDDGLCDQERAEYAARFWAVATAPPSPGCHRVPIGTMREDIVESQTTPGVMYHLKKLGDGTWRCDCPGYQYRGECKHARERGPW